MPFLAPRQKLAPPEDWEWCLSTQTILAVEFDVETYHAGDPTSH